MLDITKYEFHELSLPNIIAAIPLDRRADYEGYSYEVDPKIANFIVEAAKKFPMWKFVGSGGMRIRDDKKMVFRDFKLFDNREALGNISYSYNHKGDVSYEFANDRISNKLERGSSMRTKDIKKGLKILQGMYGAKTIRERLIRSMTEAKSEMGHIQHNRMREFSSKFVYLTDHLADYIFSNWEHYKSIALANGMDPNYVKNLPELGEQCFIARDIWNHTNKNSGVFVTIHGNDYAVIKGSATDAMPEILSTESLPEWLRRGIGMLKLVEPNHFLKDVGFRTDQNSFFVVHQEEQHD